MQVLAKGTQHLHPISRSSSSTTQLPHSLHTSRRKSSRGQCVSMCMHVCNGMVGSRGRGLWVTAASSLQETAVRFKNHRGEQLVGTLVDPPASPDTQHAPQPSSGSAGATPAAAAAAPAAATSAAPPPPPPVVLLAHGYMSSRNSELLVRLATALARSCCLSSFRFDFSGNGESQGEFRYGQYMSEAHELGLAKQHLEQQLGRRVVAMLGHSKGATDVLLYAGRLAEQYGRVPCIVNLAARLDVRQGVVQRLGQQVLEELQQRGKVRMSGQSRSRGQFEWWLRQEDLQDRLATDVAAACANIPADVAVLTVHGSGDADVPVGDAWEFDKLIQNHKLVILEGADHTFSSSSSMYELAAAVLPFVVEHSRQ